MSKQYKGHTFHKSTTTTDIYVPKGGGGHRLERRALYEVEGEHGKAPGKRPWLTTIKEVKAYITEVIADSKKVAYIFQETGGWYVNDDSASTRFLYLGEAFRTKSEAIYRARYCAYTHYRVQGRERVRTLKPFIY